MRILKYIFLLLLLFSIAVAVFVATQKGDFEVTQTRLINNPRNIVFNYVNDYRNWPSWASFDSEMEPEFPNLTSGKGGSFSWEGNENDGEVKTISVRENDSIVQKMDWNGLPADMFWTFKDSAGKTKVTLKIKGKIGFMPKIRAAMEGGANRIMNSIFEKSLLSLDKTLDKEINIYTIKVDGIAEMPAKYYLKQTIISTIDNMPRNQRIMQSKLIHFFKKNNMAMAGKPFVLYDYYDPKRNLTKFSVCVPIREEVHTSAESDVSFGKFETFRAVKTTLTGDYSHLKEAWDKTFAYINANRYTEVDADYMEWYKVGKEDGKTPSKWVTEIYVPIQEVPVAPLSTPAATPSATPKPAEPAAPSADDFNL